MKSKNLLSIFTCFLSLWSISQEEVFVHCIGNDTIYIEKINDIQNMDTIIKTYQQGSSTFNYYIYNDTIFSKHEGAYYIIGANQAQVGDIWNPFWYDYFSYTSNVHSQSNGCSLNRSLEIIAIESIDIEGQNRNKYTLLLQDNVPYNYYEDSILFHFIEGVGVTTGGPFYNLYYEGNCVMVSDVPTLSFKSYSVNNFTYLENDCSGEIVGIQQIDEAEVSCVVKNGYLWINGVSEPFEITVTDVTGKTVLKENNINGIDVSVLKGVFFIQIEQNSKNIKLIKLHLG